MSRLKAVPADVKEGATVLGMGDVRSWGGKASETRAQNAIEAYRRELNLYQASGSTGPLPPRAR